MILAGPEVELLLLLLLLVTLDSLKRVQGDTIVFRKSLLGSWRPGEAERFTRWMFPSPLTPLQMAVVAAVPDASPWIEWNLIQPRYKAAIKAIRVLRLLGLLQLSAFIIGIPLGVSRLSGAGFLAALGLTIVLDCLIAWLAWRSWRGLPRSGSPGLKKLVTWLSPFSASSAAQDVLQESLRGSNAVQVAYVLLSTPAFHEWVRPLAYDELHGKSRPPVEAFIGRSEMRAIVSKAPAADSDAVAYCPRCGRTWRHLSGSCTSCEVPLTVIPPAA